MCSDESIPELRCASLTRIEQQLDNLVRALQRGNVERTVAFIAREMRQSAVLEQETCALGFSKLCGVKERRSAAVVDAIHIGAPARPREQQVRNLVVSSSARHHQWRFVTVLWRQIVDVLRKLDARVRRSSRRRKVAAHLAPAQQTAQLVENNIWQVDRTDQIDDLIGHKVSVCGRCRSIFEATSDNWQRHTRGAQLRGATRSRGCVRCIYYAC